MTKILLCKDALNNRLISTQVLNETDNIKYEIIENAPVIEERKNEIGCYSIGEDGQLTVIYQPKPKSQLDLIQEQIDKLVENTTQILKND